MNPPEVYTLYSWNFSLPNLLGYFFFLWVSHENYHCRFLDYFWLFIHYIRYLNIGGIEQKQSKCFKFVLCLKICTWMSYIFKCAYWSIYLYILFINFVTWSTGWFIIFADVPVCCQINTTNLWNNLLHFILSSHLIVNAFYRIDMWLNEKYLH